MNGWIDISKSLTLQRLNTSKLAIDKGYFQNWIGKCFLLKTLRRFREDFK